MKSLCCGYCIMTEKQLLETLGPIFPQGIGALGERIIYMCVCRNTCCKYLSLQSSNNLDFSTSVLRLLH